MVERDGFENHCNREVTVSSNLTPSAMFNFFKKTKKEPDNLEDVLSQFNDLKKRFEKLFQELESVKQDNNLNIRKVGIVRFNPFKEIGGNQSFSVVLLDGRDNGVILTSLYSRDGNRVYGKPIKNGQSEYLLSGEEKEAISKAVDFDSQPH